MRSGIVLTLCLCLQLSSGFTQSKEINGIVLDSMSKEPMIGVTVYDAINDKIYSTNLEGRFSFKPGRKKEIELFFQYTGYMPEIYKGDVLGDTVVITLNEVNFDGPARIIPSPYFEKSKNGKEIYFYSGYKQFEPYERKVNKLLLKRKK